uniref:EF-hand domain-containing protein n=1 Tax=Mucochytrium quahogii TaxID=96639 RepID=A0A7S2RNN1_9STRA
MGGLADSFRDFPSFDEEVVRKTMGGQAKRKHVTFYLVGSQTILMSLADLRGLRLVLRALKALQMSAADIVNLFYSFYPTGVNYLTKDLFDQIVEKGLCPPGIGTERESKRIHQLYSRVFYSFDSNGEGRVLFRDILGAILCLSPDSQMDKFVFQFKLYDSNGDGCINRDQAFNLISSLLVLLLSFNHGVSLLPSRYIYSIVGETSVAILQSLLQTVDDVGAISIEEFVAWYEEIGSAFMPWAEILSKEQCVDRLMDWIRAPVEDSVCTEDEDYSDGDLRTDDEEGISVLETSVEDIPVEDFRSPGTPPDSVTPVFQYSMYDGEQLVFTPMDVELLELILNTTKLGLAPVQNVHEIFMDEVNDANYQTNALPKPVFDKCIRNLVPRERLEHSEQRYLSYTFSAFFYAFDREKKEYAPFDEFITGFSLLLGGDRVTKMLLSFPHFSRNSSGTLDSNGMTRFIRAYLTMLFALQKDAQKLKAGDIYGTIDKTAAGVTRRMYDFHENADSDTISFEEFETWYDAEGVEVAPWLQLLELKNWPVDVALCEQATEASSYNGSAIAESFRYGGSEDGTELGRDGLIFQIPLTQDADILLEFRDSDDLALHNLLRSSRLDEVDPDEIQAALLRESRGSDITISLQGFLSCIKDLINVGQDWHNIESMLTNFFSLYDPNDVDRASTVGIACGISLLAGGNKSDKLALGFALFDQDRDGFLLSKELEKFLYSLLLGLFGLTNKMNSLDTDTICWMAERSAQEATEQLVNDVFVSSTGKGGCMISFDDFAQWYADGGYDVIPWIELFDLSKWPMGNCATFDLHPGLRLTLSKEDNALVQLMSKRSSFGSCSPQEMKELFEHYAVKYKGQALILSEFEQLLSSQLDPADSECWGAFMSIFKTFELWDPEQVPLSKLLCGMLIFAEGKKSNKLGAAFYAFDTDSDGSLTRGQLHSFFMSFLLGLLAASELGDSNEGSIGIDLDDVHVICECVVDLTAKVLTQSASLRENTDLISFSEFAAWYSKDGFNVIPWLELLDLTKWPRVLRLPADSTSDATGGEKGLETNGDDPVFVFDLTKGGKTLRIIDRDVEHLTRLISLSRFSQIPPDDLKEHFNNASVSRNGEKFLPKTGLDEVLRRLVPGSKLNDDDKRFLSLTFSSLYLAFDRDGNRLVPFSDICSGLLVLGKGSKSDKLALAWGLFGDTKTNKMNKANFSRYLASFLTIFFALSEEVCEGLPAKEGWDIVDQSISEFSEQVYEDLELSPRDTISFEDFATWYTEGGHEIIPWLELLCLDKWST